MGGRTNNAGDWLTGKSQAQFEKQAGHRKASAELLRKSGYRRAIDEATGEEYDWRERAQASGNTMYSGLDEEGWKGAGESFIGGMDKDPFGTSSGGAEPKPVGPPPKTMDATDDALRKARTNAFLRLQSGKNQGNSMGQKLGAFDVAKPVLGGY